MSDYISPFHLQTNLFNNTTTLLPTHLTLLIANYERRFTRQIPLHLHLHTPYTYLYLYTYRYRVRLHFHLLPSIWSLFDRITIPAATPAATEAPSFGRSLLNYVKLPAATTAEPEVFATTVMIDEMKKAWDQAEKAENEAEQEQQ